MAITYVKKKYGETDVKFPVLHRIVYDRRLNESVLAGYQRSLKDVKVDAWLSENCRSSYYHGPGYIHEKFIEFEDDVEATMFALKWGA